MTKETAAKLMPIPRPTLRIIYALGASGKTFATYSGLGLALGYLDPKFATLRRQILLGINDGYLAKYSRGHGAGRGNKSVVYLTEKGLEVLAIIRGEIEVRNGN